MNNLLVSETKKNLENWNLEDIFDAPSKQMDIERLLQYDHDNTIGKCCNGLTYLEIEQLDNTFNNFK